MLIQASFDYDYFVIFCISIIIAKFGRCSFFLFSRNLKFLERRILTRSLLEPAFEFRFIDFEILFFKVPADTCSQLLEWLLSFFVGFNFETKPYLRQYWTQGYSVYLATSFRKFE